MSCWLQEESVSSGEDEGESEVEEQASPGDAEKTQPSLDFNHILNSLQPQYVSILASICKYFRCMRQQIIALLCLCAYQINEISVYILKSDINGETELLRNVKSSYSAGVRARLCF